MRHLFIVLLALFSTNLAAQSFTDIDKDDDGLIEVSDLETLNAVRYRLDGSGLKLSPTAEAITTGCAVGGCKGYELTRDLDFNDAASYQNLANMKLWTTDAGWQPIGTAEQPFTAIFKTNNSSTPNTIFNLTISRADENNVGLFGHIGSTAEISGIGLLDAAVEGNHQVGGLVGKNAGGKISNSYVNGRVVGKGGEIGLLVGRSSGSITNSYANGEVLGEANGIGGLVGANHGEITNSYAMGSVVGSANNVGGLVGDNMLGTISNCYTTGSVSGNEDIGGLVGLSNLGTLIGNYVSGKASGTRYIGGLVGSNIGGTITQSYWDKTASKLEGNTGGVGLLASELQSANAQDEDLNKPYYKWSTAHWDFGTAEQYPILKYATGSDLNKPACGPEQTLPNCGALLLGQHASLERILFLSDVDLSPSFKPTELNYQLGITTGTKTLQLIPIASNPDSTINISRNGTMIDSDLTSGTTSSAITLSENTEIVIEVSATNQRPARYSLTSNYLREITILGIPDRAVYEGEPIMLDASQNLETADTLMSYHWTQSRGKTLFPSPDSESAILWLDIPEDYVPATEEHANLGLTLEINDGKATIIKNITLTIAKVNNGNIPVTPPTLTILEGTAPEIDLSKDPDGSGKDFSYQWQSRAPGQDTEWINIDEATEKTHIISFLTESYTEYRVLINYTDGQGYKTIAASRAARYVPEIMILDSIKGLASEQTIPGDAKPQRTSHSTTATASTCSPADIDHDNDGLIDICDLEGLNAMRHQLDGIGYRETSTAGVKKGCYERGISECKGYELIKDLDFDDNASYSSTPNKVIWTKGEGWDPIGAYESYHSASNKPFKTIFEGNGHSISNLMIDRPNTNGVGFFSYVKGGNINDVDLSNINIKGNGYVGGLVGHNYGTITNSTATGVVEGYYAVGGLVGRESGGTIMNSYAMSAVEGNSDVGGLAGHNSRGTITNSYATGAVTGTGSYIGGLVGWNSSGNITNSYATGAVKGWYRMGGLVGLAGGNITNSYATGAVVGRSGLAGGLVGDARGNITNSYATGSVVGNGRVGGLVGHNYGTITNSYATGFVVENGRSVAGGLVGNNEGRITNSYWDTQTSRIASGVNGRGLTTAQLQSPTNAIGIYAQWSTGNWNFGTDEQYPILKYATACSEQAGTDLPVCGSLLSPVLRYGLRELLLVKGNLSPSFIVASQNYAGTAVSTANTIQFKPIALKSNATISISGDGGKPQNIPSGTTSSEIILKEDGITKIIISVKNGGTNPPIEYTLRLDYHKFEGDVYEAFSGDVDEDNDGLIDIDSLEKLNAMRYQLDGTGYRVSEDAFKVAIGCPDNKCKGYELRENLDFNDKSEWTTGAGWQPIGGELYRFNSIFEGNNHTISNLIVNRPRSSNLGLFGGAGVDAEISNIGLLNVDIKGNGSIGGLVGENLGIITNSYTTGTVAFGQQGVFGSGEGGLVGYNRGVVANSYSLVELFGRKHVGGLVGRNHGKITNSYAGGSVVGRWESGGLVGWNANGGQVTNSYATGEVRGSRKIGGLVGWNWHSSIKNSYATGSVSGNSDVGGLIGANDGTITYSYWDTETSGQTISAGGTSKTTIELKSAIAQDEDRNKPYYEWKTTDWYFGTSQQYPALKYAKGTDEDNPACSEQAGTDLPVCGSLLSPVFRGLKELRLVEGSLSPSFTVAKQNYVGTVVSTAKIIQFKLTAINSAATISISGDGGKPQNIPSGTTSSVIMLKRSGITRIIISVKNGGTTSPIEYILNLDYYKFEGKIDTDGNGLINIDTLEKLNAMRYQLDGTGYRDSEDAPKITIGCPDNKCKGYELKKDLDFNDDASYSSTPNKVIWTTGSGWQPIGYYESSNSVNNKPFTAIFEGNGYTISNLIIDRPDINRVGLFGHTEGGTVNNVGLSNIDITGDRHVGGLVGYSIDSTITNSYATGTVQGRHSVGGLVGFSYGDSDIRNSYATGAVKGRYSVGSLVGRTLGGTITNSYATGAVTGTEDRVGGLVGRTLGGTITNSYATGAVTGKSTSYYVGGLVGDSTDGTITASYWDTQTSEQTISAGGTSKTTIELQEPTSASGIYAQWKTADWHFGTSGQYPALKYAVGPDTDNPACGSDEQQPACGTLLSLQRFVRLEQLTVSPGTLQFDPPTYDYNVTVDQDVDSITLNTTATGATIHITSDTSGVEDNTMDTSSVTIPLTITGDTIITIELTEGEQRPTRYTITVSHNIPDNPGSPEITVTIDKGNPRSVEEIPVNEGQQVELDTNPSSCTLVNVKCQLRISGYSSLLSDPNILNFTIPVDFVEANQSTQKLVVVFSTQKDGEGENITSKETTFVVKKIDNGSISIGQPTLFGSQLIAPNLLGDPEGVQKSSVEYQWQRKAGRWVDISEATARTYTPGDMSGGEEYHVRISYTDGQGYCYGDGEGCAQAIYSEATRGDIDVNGNGLIEIRYINDLDAMRYVRDGSGYQKSSTASKIITGCPEDGCKGYELVADLDFNDNASYSSTSNKVIWTTGSGWLPIGSTNMSNKFSGKFNGNNKKIENLMIKSPGSAYIGLFAMIGEAAIIEDVNLHKVDIEGGELVGALVGKNSGGTISNIQLEGDSSTTSTIVGTGSRVGGLVGMNVRGIIINSRLSGDSAAITNRVEGDGNRIGGLVGENEGGRIINSHAVANIQGRETGRTIGYHVGGLVGYNTGQIINSYADGSVAANENVGGLVGNHLIGDHATGEIINSYAMSRLVSGNENVGGLVGLNFNGPITHSYWDKTTSKMSSSDGGVGKTTTELQSPIRPGSTSTKIYYGWREEIWDFGTNKQYPALKYANAQCTGTDKTDYCEGLSPKKRTYVESLCPLEDTPAHCDELFTGQRLGLKSIELSGNAALSKAFENTRYSYTMLVLNGEETIQTTLTAFDSNAEITLSPSDNSNEITLENGQSTPTITIVVKANNREVTYTFKVKRVGARITEANDKMKITEKAFDEGTSVSFQAKAKNSEHISQIRWEWQIGDESLVESTDNDKITLTSTANYIVGTTSSATVTLEVTGTFTIGSKVLESSAEVELTINNVDNGHLMRLLNAPRLEEATSQTDLHLVAPDLSDYVSTNRETDPDNGINENKITYQWQSRTSDSDSWSNIGINGDKKTYEILHTSPFNTQYRVKLGYTDGQGHRRSIEDGGLVSEAITVKHVDRDNNGLIDIFSAETLAAIRHQLDGSGYKKSSTSTETITEGCLVNEEQQRQCNGYELKAHIDLSGWDWKPIDNANKPFNAIFEGNHYTISNLTINRSVDGGSVGLFGRTAGTAKIRNVGLLNVKITNTTGTIISSVGGLIGSNLGKVEGSYVIAAKGNVTEISGTDKVGGLIGSNQGEVKGSYVIAKLIKGDSIVGGLVGRSEGTITNSYAIVKNIISNKESVGGLVGVTSGGKISNSHAKVDNIKKSNSFVCPNGSLMLVGKNDDATNPSEIIKSKMAGDCGAPPLFD